MGTFKGGAAGEQPVARLNGRAMRRAISRIPAEELVTMTPEAFLARIGVKRLENVRLHAKGFCKPDDVAMHPTYFGRQVLAPAGRSFQGRYASAGDLLMLGYPREEVDRLVGRYIAFIQERRRVSAGRRNRGQAVAHFGEAWPVLAPQRLEAKPSLERVHKKGRKPVHTKHPALLEGRSLYPASVETVDEGTRFFHDGKANAKVGAVVIGPDGIMWGQLFTLSWEERRTCPRACHHWQTCYTNNSPHMNRKDYDLAREEEILARMEAELVMHLQTVAAPYLYVRLHQSGDFPTLRNVQWWGEMLARYPRLMVFGYSHWLSVEPEGEIAKALRELNSRYWQSRWRVFSSNGGLHGQTAGVANTYESVAAALQAGAMPCPEQRGYAPSCGECQMCLPGPHSRGQRFEGPLGFVRHQTPQDPEHGKSLTDQLQFAI